MGIMQRFVVPAREGASRQLDNEDLRPTPREKRTWGLLLFNCFWFSAVTNVSNFLGGSSFLSLGLTYWEGLGCSTAGYFLISFFMVACGRFGAKWHVGFPVACRSSFGVYGAGWPALNRAFMACLWQGVNAVSGAQALYIVLYSMFPSIKTSIHNTMDSRSALNSAEMLCFFLFQGLVGLMCILRVQKWGTFVYTKVAVFCISSAGMLAWSITAAGGVGPVVSQGSKIHGSEKSWLLVRMILTSAASCSTFASNASDWQRMAIKPSDPILGQLLGFPISNFITQVIGMLIASTSEGVYGKLVWNPVTYLKMLLEDNYDSKHRAGAFFIAAGFVYSLLFSCLFENVYCCGNDLSSLCPKYISIKRGFFICIAVSCIINPWYLLGSASIFITVISSYQIFLFSIIGVLLVDYYAVAKGFLDIDALFSANKNGKYWYWNGINLRAIAAYFVGVGVSFAGFLTNFGVIKSVKLTHSYYFSIVITTTAAGGTYYILTKLFPQANAQQVWSEPRGIWEPTDAQATVGGVAAFDDDKAESFDKEDEARAEIREAAVPELSSRGHA
ncbi:hypothetical protein JCM10207_000080 [Rhodosporidiobolus poonsookiae]